MTTYDVADITQYLKDSGYPVDDYFTDSSNTPITSIITRITSNAQRDISIWIPLTEVGTFNTVIGQSDYDIFNYNQLVTPPAELVNANGLRASEVIWFPNTDFGSFVDIFGIAPILQSFGAGQNIGILDFSFITPSDFNIYYDNYDKWRTRFAGNYYANLPENSAPITLYPTPQSVLSVSVKYKVVRPLTDRNWPDAAFRYMIESQACKVISRMKAEEDQITINQFKAPSATSFYTKEAQRMHDLAIEELRSSRLFREFVGTRS